MKRFLFLLGTLLIAGCGGGGSGSAPHAGNDSGTTPQGMQKITITIGGALTQPKSKKRHPAYISASMQSVSVAANGGTPVIQACMSTCTVTVGVPYGTDTFVVSTYDRAPSNGAIPQGANLLSTGTASADITTTDTSVTVVTGAVVDPSHSTVTLAASDADVLNGATTTGTVSIGGAFADADGNVIPPSSALAPIAIDNGGNSAVTVPATAGGTTTVQSTTDIVSYKYAAGTCTVATCSPPSTCPASTCGELRATVVATSDVLNTLTLMPAPYFVFIGNKASETLSIFSPTRHTMIGSMTFSSGADDIAVNPTATTVYAANQTSGSVSVVDVTHKNVPALSSVISGFPSIAAGNMGLGLDSVHGTLYVGEFNPTNATNVPLPGSGATLGSGLYSVPAAGGSFSTLIAGVGYYGPEPIVDPTGSCVYGPTYGENLLGDGDDTGFDVYNINSSTNLGYIPALYTGPLVVTPTNSHIYTLQVPGPPDAIYIFDVGSNCAVTPDATPTIIQTLSGNPKGMTINRTGTRLYVGSGSSAPNLAVFAFSGAVPGSETDYSVANGNDSGGFSLSSLAVAGDGILYGVEVSGGTLHVIDPTGYPGTIIEEPWSPISSATGSVIKIAP